MRGENAGLGGGVSLTPAGPKRDKKCDIRSRFVPTEQNNLPPTRKVLYFFPFVCAGEDMYMMEMHTALKNNIFCFLKKYMSVFYCLQTFKKQILVIFLHLFNSIFNVVALKFVFIYKRSGIALLSVLEISPFFKSNTVLTPHLHQIMIIYITGGGGACSFYFSNWNPHSEIEAVGK